MAKLISNTALLLLVQLVTYPVFGFLLELPWLDKRSFKLVDFRRPEEIPEEIAELSDGLRPDLDRVREPLEDFPLDTLRMVGTLDINETVYGLVQTSDGLIHRVIPGNYLGQNDGRITDISESEILLVEIISDGIGGYIERDAAIGLSD